MGDDWAAPPAELFVRFQLLYVSNHRLLLSLRGLSRLEIKNRKITEGLLRDYE